MKTYTLGEILRLGLLKNHKGDPYKHKATISKIVASLPHRVKKTVHGPAKVVDEEAIARFNKHWAKFD